MQERSDKLKDIILQRYPSVRMFAQEVGIPHGTLVSALNNGIDGMAWGRLNAVCEKLQIDPVSLEPVRPERGKNTAEEKRLLAYYELLNTEGKSKVDAYLKDISMIPAYYEKK
ncbi:MAG: transcriptional regulator [Lachnospiraceae bacterium]|nr:transcriptional regulator [Lachnospiraceae bacterium]